MKINDLYLHWWGVLLPGRDRKSTRLSFQSRPTETILWHVRLIFCAVNSSPALNSSDPQWVISRNHRKSSNAAAFPYWLCIGRCTTSNHHCSPLLRKNHLASAAAAPYSRGSSKKVLPSTQSAQEVASCEPQFTLAAVPRGRSRLSDWLAATVSGIVWNRVPQSPIVEGSLSRLSLAKLQFGAEIIHFQTDPSASLVPLQKYV